MTQAEVKAALECDALAKQEFSPLLENSEKDSTKMKLVAAAEHICITAMGFPNLLVIIEPAPVR